MRGPESRITCSDSMKYQYDIERFRNLYTIVFSGSLAEEPGVQMRIIRSPSKVNGPGPSR